MKDTILHVGLDVHKASIPIGVAEEGGGDPEILATIPATIPNELTFLSKHLRKLGPLERLTE